MALLNFPTVLTDLQSLSDYGHVACVGRSMPMVKRCANFLNATDESFCLAIGKLQELSKSRLSLLASLDKFSIGALQDIAQGFSCKETHRKSTGAREQLPYYWVALDILPSFLGCMGFNDFILKACSIEKQDTILAAVNKMSPGDLWILDQAMDKLNYDREGRWDKRNDAVASFFMDRVTARLDQDSHDDEKYDEQMIAKERWERWHDVSDRQRKRQKNIIQSHPNTPPRNNEVAQPGSAPDIMQSSLGRKSSSFTPTKSQSRPLAAPLQKTSPASPHTTDKLLRNMSENSSSHRLWCASASPLTFGRAANHHVKHDQVTRNALTLDGGHHTSLSENDPQDDVDMPAEVDSGTTEHSNDFTTGVTTPECERQSLISDRFEILKKPWQIRYNISKVFNLMRQPLKEQQPLKAKVDPKEGYIYAFYIVDHPGYVKIGFAGNDSNERKEAIEKCLSPLKIEPVGLLDDFEVPSYQKVERLIQTELQPYRRRFKCDKAKCSNAGHTEWFEIDEDKAKESIDRWKDWMRTTPYDSTRCLNSIEAHRIDVHQKMIIKNKQSRFDEWSWAAFMQYSPSVREKLSHLLDRKRPEKMTSRSLMTSFWDNWPSIFIFYTVIFAVSGLAFAVADYGFSSPSSGVYHGLVDSVILGSIGVLYAL